MGRGKTKGKGRDLACTHCVRVYLATGKVGGEFVQGNVVEEILGEGERGEAGEDEVVDEAVQPLEAVEQSQFLQVQVVVLTHLLLQVLAAEIHHSPHLIDSRVTFNKW